MASKEELEAAQRQLQKESIELNQIQALLGSKVAILRRNRLTEAEIEHITDANAAFVSVGRLFVSKTPSEIKADLKASNVALEDDLARLETSRSHLERSFAEHKDAFTEMLRSKA